MFNWYSWQITIIKFNKKYTVTWQNVKSALDTISNSVIVDVDDYFDKCMAFLCIFQILT